MTFPVDRAFGNRKAPNRNAVWCRSYYWANPCMDSHCPCTIEAAGPDFRENGTFSRTKASPSLLYLFLTRYRTSGCRRRRFPDIESVRTPRNPHRSLWDDHTQPSFSISAYRRVVGDRKEGRRSIQTLCACNHARIAIEACLPRIGRLLKERRVYESFLKLVCRAPKPPRNMVL
jgi:hypothetical protein